MILETGTPAARSACASSPMDRSSRRRNSSPDRCPGLSSERIVRVRGDLVTPVNPELGRIIDERILRGDRRVLLDLSGVRDIDAAGVGELVRAYTIVKTAGGALRVTHANKYVRRLLEISGLYTLLTGGTGAALTAGPAEALRA